jgi:hypothetical protein
VFDLLEITNLKIKFENDRKQAPIFEHKTK